MATPKEQLLSRTVFDTDGVTTVWDFAFSGGYLANTHVKAYVENPLGLREQLIFDPGIALIGEFQLEITPALEAGNELVIYRDTPKDLPLVDFSDESGFSEISLDTNAKQAVFIAAEAIDTVNATDVSAAIGAAELAVAAQLAAEASAAGALSSQTAAAASAVAAAASASNASSNAAAAISALNDAIAIYGSIAGVQAAAAAADASATAAAVSESAAAGSANAAATSATNASNSASTAATSASTATAQASNAAASATAASNSAAAAAGSATAASNSATSAAGSASAAAVSASSAATSASNAIATLANNPGRNKIINGKMVVAQRGTSFAAIASGAYSLDRWVYGASTAAVVTANQQADAPADNEFQNSLRIAVTTADSSITTTDNARITQVVEGFNARDLIGRTFTLSFRVRSSKTGVHCVALRNSGADRSYVAEYTISAANTWENKTITVSGGLITAGTWNWTNGYGVSVEFMLACGPTLQTTAGAWQTGNFLATANQVNCLDTIGNIFAITGVQLEVGSAATPFEHRPVGAELALCQRYYFRVGNQNDFYYRGTTGSAATFGLLIKEFPVTMRAAPTFNSSSATFNTNLCTFNTNNTTANRHLSLIANSNSAGQDAFAFLSSGFVDWTAEL